jgi:hypothetical protein
LILAAWVALETKCAVHDRHSELPVAELEEIAVVECRLVADQTVILASPKLMDALVVITI